MSDEEIPGAIGAALRQLRAEVAAMKVRSLGDRIWDVLTRLAVALSIASFSWVWSTDRRVLYIESTRLTALDFERAQASRFAEVVAKLDAVRDDLGGVRERLAAVEQQVKK